jgi:phosphohistidine swiveling domain-containing protein
LRLKRWSLLGGLVSIAIVLVVGCGASGGGRTVVPVTIDPAALSEPRDSRALTTHDAAVRGIAAILVKELGLPVPEHVTVYVYASREVFQQGLIQDAQISPVRAAELSDFAIGVGKRRQLLFNDEAYDHRGREWLRLVSHEMTHVSQIEMAQGEGRAEQWLAEGMAEWVAFTVLERLGLDTMARRRTLAEAGIRSHAALVAARLDLETLGSPRGFTVRHLREGSLPTYQLAFLMSDYLITRDGMGKVTTYFKSLSQRQNRFENFRRAFGQSLDDFEHEVLGYLKSVVH